MAARLSAATLGSLLALAVATPAAAETTTIGKVAPAGDQSSSPCIGCTGLQLATATSSPSYVVPAGNWRRLVAWRIRGGAEFNGHAALRIFRPTATPGRYRLVNQSEEGTVPAKRVSRFGTSIPVRRGDLLGLRTGNDPGDLEFEYQSASPDDLMGAVIGDPVIDDTVGAGGDDDLRLDSSFLLNASATLYRPPPETTITKQPAEETSSRRARFKFRSDAPNPRFKCKLDDRRRFKACDSPRRYKHLSRGRHSFEVKAIAGGVQDRTPAEYAWRISR
jgi:hypothetical protein